MSSLNHLPLLLLDVNGVINDLNAPCRALANDELAARLGVGPFPAIDPHGNERFGTGWKTEHVRPLAEAALGEGRSVVWIEDFNGVLPDLSKIPGDRNSTVAPRASPIARPSSAPAR